ncbi:DEAD/DEAH box helicase, partial [bacterium]|nr:DEAD/DEAH box helicase [bacterium]
TQSKGQCFLKLKGGVFTQILEGKKEAQWKDTFSSPANESGEIPEQAQLYAPSGPWLPASQTLATLLPLQNRGFKLFYEKMPLDELRLEDIQTEFHLLDPHELANDQKNIDWFALHPKLFFKGVEMNEKQLAQITQSGVLEFQGKVYLIPNKNLPSLRRLEAFWTKIQGNKTIKLRRKTSETYYTLAKNQTLELLALMKQGAKITGGGERWKSIREFYESLDQPRKPLELPSSLRAELKPYQVYGVQWLLDLYHLGLGGILADDMGLGKTVQALSFMEYYKRTEGKLKALVVCPTTLIYNWENEIRKFTPSLSFRIHHGASRTRKKEELEDHDITITTYGTLRSDIKLLSQIALDYAILDESQAIKNPSSKVTKAASLLQARHRLCMSGTP